MDETFDLSAAPSVSDFSSFNDTITPRKESLSVSALMKSSFSMSSLRDGSPDTEASGSSPATLPRRKRRERRRDGGGSRNKKKDEFWAALQSNYDYLMDEGLIETCREANDELSADDDDEDEADTWTFKEFLDRVADLSEWIDRVYSGSSRRPDNDDELGKMETLQPDEKRFRLSQLKLVNDQSQRLGRRYPDMRDEIVHRMEHLRLRWNEIEESQEVDLDEEMSALKAEMSCQLRWLRKWLREIEEKLDPLVVGQRLSSDEVVGRLHHQVVLQKEIESRCKNVSAIVKLGETLHNRAVGQQKRRRAEHAIRVASNLQRRFHGLWIRSLEWQCWLEGLLLSGRLDTARRQEEEDVDSDGGQDDEPSRKYRRLTSGSDMLVDAPRDHHDVGYSSESSAHHSNEDSAGESVRVYTYTSAEATTPRVLEVVVDGELRPRRTPPRDPTAQTPHVESAGPNCATFYFRHEDSDVEVSGSGDRRMEGIHRLVSEAEQLVKPASGERKSWRRRRRRAADTSSCDASGEYTTTSSSDSEASCGGSVVDLHQRSCGSDTSGASTVCRRRRKKRVGALRPRSFAAGESCRRLAALSASESAINRLSSFRSLASLRHSGSLDNALQQPSSTDTTDDGTLACTPDSDDSLPAVPLSSAVVAPAVDDLSSVSEQAWDDYQDPPYLSDAYSEQAVDDDVARQLLNFGDDYRAFIESHSDGTSTPSLRRCRPRRGVKTLGCVAFDSESDVDDLRDVIGRHLRQLHLIAARLDELSAANELGEVLATCQTHIRCLDEMLKVEGVFPVAGVRQAAEKLRLDWVELMSRAEHRLMRQQLVGEVKQVMGRLEEVLADEQPEAIVDRSSLDDELFAAKKRMSVLTEVKNYLTKANFKVRGLADDDDDDDIGAKRLRADVVDAYRLWDRAHSRIDDRLKRLEEVHSTWEERLDDTRLMLSSEGESPAPLYDGVVGRSPVQAICDDTRECSEVTSDDGKVIGIERRRHRRSFVWRVIRAALPFQLAVMAVFCLACIFQPPNCCDTVNNLHYSLSPQLRYVRGPPPV